MLDLAVSRGVYDRLHYVLCVHNWTALRDKYWYVCHSRRSVAQNWTRVSSRVLRAVLERETDVALQIGECVHLLHDVPSDSRYLDKFHHLNLLITLCFLCKYSDWRGPMNTKPRRKSVM